MYDDCIIGTISLALVAAAAHIPFAHHSLQSVRSDARDIPMSVYVSNFTHVEVFFEDESRGKIRE